MSYFIISLYFLFSVCIPCSLSAPTVGTTSAPTTTTSQPLDSNGTTLSWQDRFRYDVVTSDTELEQLIERLKGEARNSIVYDRRNFMDDSVDLDEINKIIEDRPTTTTEPAVELCPICKDDLINGEPIKRLICSHKFHQACFDQWRDYVKREVTRGRTYYCPTCRRPGADGYNED